MTDAPERIWIEVCADLVEALEIENHRLRKALKEIDHGDGWGWCGQIARAALSGEGET